MVSGECAVAPSTPNPPARLTAATTSRQWLNASSGNSMPSISQIGDFIGPPSDTALLAGLGDKASLSGATKPTPRHCERSEAIQGPQTLEPLDCFVASLLAMTKNQFRGAEY